MVVPDEIKVGVDGNIDNAHLTYSKRPNATNDDWPFDHPMDIIMNIAIGGTLGGTVPAGDFTYEMLVDYVRVYQGEWTTGAGTDTGTDGDDNTGGTSATVYDSTDILHLGNADPGSAAELTVSKTGDDQLTVMMVSADTNDPIDVITHGALPAGATPSNIRVEDGVGYMDLSWAAGTMPATTSLEILWSKASFEGNWLIQPDQLGEIDTSHVASVDPGTGDGGDTDTSTGGGTTPQAVPVMEGILPRRLILVMSRHHLHFWLVRMLRTWTLRMWCPCSVTNTHLLSMVLLVGATVLSPRWTSTATRSRSLIVRSGIFFDIPTDVSSGSAETLSISLFRTMSSDFEIKLVDTTNGGGEGIYYIPAAQMPVNQWVTVDIPMSSFRGNDSMTGGPIAADLNIDQLVVKPMNNYDPSVGGPRETFYMDDMYFSGSGIGAGTDTGTDTDTDTGGSATTYDSVTLDYETVEGTGANFVFDGGQASVITATGSGGSDTQVLEVVKGTGGATWAGVKLLIAEAGSNLIADPTAAITVDVWSPNADGSVTLKLEGPNGSTEETFSGLTSGWNAISWTPSSTQPMDTLVFFPDLGAVAADQAHVLR